MTVGVTTLALGAAVCALAAVPWQRVTVWWVEGPKPWRRRPRDVSAEAVFGEEEATLEGARGPPPCGLQAGTGCGPHHGCSHQACRTRPG